MITVIGDYYFWLTVKYQKIVYHYRKRNHSISVIQTVSQYFFFSAMSNCRSFCPGMCLGSRLQAAEWPGAGSEGLPRLQRKGWLSGHYCDLPSPSTAHPTAQPGAALHWLSGRSKLPRPRTSGGDSQSDHQLNRSEWEKHWVPVSAGWCCENHSARGHRYTSVFSWIFGEGKNIQWAETPRQTGWL